MHARIAYYQFKPGKAEEVARNAEEGMLPIFRKHAGFHSYQAIITGADTGYTISIWENEQQAAEAVQAAAGWVKENSADLVISVQNHVGRVVFSHRANEK